MQNLISYLAIGFLSINSLFTFSQSTHTFQAPGFYNSIQWSKDKTPVNTGQAWVSSNNFYFEGRYNYEDVKTFSFYAGRTFKTRDSVLLITPSVGIVLGNFNGISFSTYLELNTKWINAFSENEYVIDENDKLNNFFFTWSGITFPVHKNIGIGIGCQWTVQPNEKLLKYGPMLSLHKGAFKLDGYAFNFWQTTKVWTIGIGYEF